MRRLAPLPLAISTIVATTSPSFAAWPSEPDTNRFVQFIHDPKLHFAYSDGEGGLVSGARMKCICNNYPGWGGRRLDADANHLWPTPPQNFYVVGGQHVTSNKGSAVASDGAGGVIAFWDDLGPINARRTRADGTQPYPLGGLSLYGLAFSPKVIAASEDGAGGAVVFFADNRTGAPGLYAQRVDSQGNVAWAANGVRISQHPYAHLAQWGRGIADGTGNVIVYWVQYGELRAQRIAPNGATRWGPYGVFLATVDMNPSLEEYAHGRTPLIADGHGGAYLLWLGGAITENDIAAQHLDSLGVELWDSGGRGVAGGDGIQRYPTAASDGADGVWMLWDDASGVWIQHFDAAGDPTYQDQTGSLLAAASRDPDVIADGSGGVYMAWSDGNTVRAQHRTAAGADQWAAAGLAVSTYPSQKARPMLVPGGPGHVVVAWIDSRPQPSWIDPTTPPALGVYAQRVPFEPILAVESPDTTPLTLRFPFGNRLSSGPLVVDVGLRAHAPATIELFDLLGRRIARTVTTSTTTSERVTLSEAAALGDGLYFLRATQGTATASARLLVLR